MLFNCYKILSSSEVVNTDELGVSLHVFVSVNNSFASQTDLTLFLLLYFQKGLINFMGISFFIQPLPNHLTTHNASKDGSRSHLIYKRSLLDKVKSKFDLEG